MPGSTVSGASVYAGVQKTREEKVKEAYAWVDVVSRRGVQPPVFVYASDGHARLGSTRPALRHERGTVPEVAMRYSRRGLRLSGPQLNTGAQLVQKTGFIQVPPPRRAILCCRRVQVTTCPLRALTPRHVADRIITAQTWVS